MKLIKRLTALMLCLLLTLSALPVQAENIKIGKLTEKLTLLDAVTVCVAIAENYGASADFTTMKTDASLRVCTIKAGVFTLSVTVDENAVATAVGVSAAYLDAEYAQQMGAIFGMMLSTFSDVKSLAALNGLDFNAFNTLKASNQTVISGDYKITMAVDPDSATPYSFTLALNAAVPVETSASVNRQEEARLILGRMNIDVCAAFLYDEKTDSNGKLGKAGSYYSKINFARTAIRPGAPVAASLGVEDGGSIEVFATPADAIARSADVQSKLPLVKSKEYHFVYGSALLRLSGATSPADVGRIVSAFIIAVNGDMAPTQTAATSAATPTATPKPAGRAAVKAGDRVTFGHYEQDGRTTNGKEAIEWIVLEVKDGNAMLVSVYALDVYNTYWGSRTWDNSTLRTWLNGTFYNNAFSATEKATIVAATVSADKHPFYTTNPGTATRDKVFCLSYAEADRLMTVSQRKCVATTYARQTRQVYTEGSYCYWWLRTPGKPTTGASIVCTDGSYDYDASYDGFCYGVRPCIRVPADSPLLKKQ